MEVLEIIVVFILTIFAIKGMKQGLILTVCSFLTVFLAISITQVISPQVSSSIRKDEKIVTGLSGEIENVLFKKQSIQNDEKKTQEQRIEGLTVPKILKRKLVENNKVSNYEQMGVTDFEEYICIYITYSIINSLCYIVIFILSLSLLKFTAKALNLISKLPVIHTLNKLGGLIIGILEGLIIVWIGFVGILVLYSTGLGVTLMDQVNNSSWLTYLYDNNIILNTISHITNSVF